MASSKTDSIYWLIGFVVTYIAVYILNFTVFGKEPTAYNLIIEVLPVIGMVALNIGFRLKKAADIDLILSDPALFAAVSGYGDHAISYVVRVWTKTENYWDVYNTVTYNIKKEFDENGIEMTYPHLNVHLDK